MSKKDPFPETKDVNNLECGMVLDSETFYNNSLSMIPTAAIDEIQPCSKNRPVLKYLKCL